MKFRLDILILSSLSIIGCVPSPQNTNINCQTMSLRKNNAKEYIRLDTLNFQKKRITGLVLIGIRKEELSKCIITYTLKDDRLLTYTYNETVGTPIYGQIGWSPTNWYAPTPSVWLALDCQLKALEVSSIEITIIPTSVIERKIKLALAIFPGM